MTIADCGMRNADCEIRSTNLKFAIRNPKSEMAQ